MNKDARLQHHAALCRCPQSPESDRRARGFPNTDADASRTCAGRAVTVQTTSKLVVARNEGCSNETRFLGEAPCQPAWLYASRLMMENTKTMSRTVSCETASGGDRLVDSLASQ